MSASGPSGPLVGSVTGLVHLSSEVGNDWFTSYWKCDRIGSLIIGGVI